MAQNTSGLKRGGSPGRPRGVPNKATVEIRDAARRLLEDEAYQRGLSARLIKGRAPHMETLLYHYAYGKPKETMDLRVSDVSLLSHEELRERAAGLLARLEGVSLSSVLPRLPEGLSAVVARSQRPRGALPRVVPPACGVLCRRCDPSRTAVYGRQPHGQDGRRRVRGDLPLDGRVSPLVARAAFWAMETSW